MGTTVEVLVAAWFLLDPPAYCLGGCRGGWAETWIRALLTWVTYLITVLNFRSIQLLMRRTLQIPSVSQILVLRSFWNWIPNRIMMTTVWPMSSQTEILMMAFLVWLGLEHLQVVYLTVCWHTTWNKKQIFRADWILRRVRKSDAYTIS